MLFVSVRVRLPLSSACFPPSFSLFYLIPTACSWQQRGHMVGQSGYICSPFSPGDMPDAPSPSTPIFDHMVKRECFLLLLDCAFKNPFLHPVCLCCMSDENSDLFFPARSASSGIANSPLHPVQTHTHTPPTLKHHYISFCSRDEEATDEKKTDTVYL